MRVTLPVNGLAAYGIAPGDEVRIKVGNDGIVVADIYTNGNDHPTGTLQCGTVDAGIMIMARDCDRGTVDVPHSADDRPGFTEILRELRDERPNAPLRELAAMAREQAAEGRKLPNYWVA